MIKSNMNEIGSLLDDTIKKGESVKENQRQALKKSDQLRKALSHDPFSPVTMGPESPYYNPYTTAPEGGYMPHSPHYWADQGKDLTVDEYHTSMQFLGMTSVATSMVAARAELLTQATNRFAKMSKALEECDLIKAGAVPVGTIHTYKDGQKYKKVAEGKWQPVVHGMENASLRDRLNDPKEGSRAGELLEHHAKLNDHLSSRKREDDRHNKTHAEVLNTVMSVMESVFDGPVPASLQAKVKTKLKELGQDGEGQKKPEDHLKEMSTRLAGKRHNVTAAIQINGKVINHTFNNIPGKDSEEVKQIIAEELKEKIPGASIGDMKVEVIPEKKNWRPVGGDSLNQR